MRTTVRGARGGTSATRNRMPRRKTVKLPGRHVKEASILTHVKQYLQWEGFVFFRLQAGRWRAGGEPVKVPPQIVAQLQAAFPNIDAKKWARWDGYIRLGEQWAEMAPAGSPDIMVEVPANRPVLNTLTGEQETSAFARTIYIETKRPKGGVKSQEQKDFQAAAVKRGALFFFIDSPEKLRRCLPPKMELNLGW